jgi:divalent metal cation (Fe/Co/Zn/Cd) transporter
LGITILACGEKTMTALATMEQDVAKKKAAQVRNDEAVRIRSDVAAKARVAAAYLGLSITEYISNVLDPIVEKDIEEGHIRLRKAAPKPKRSGE